MTIRQYQILASTIANKITTLGFDPCRVRNLKNECVTVPARDPKHYKDMPVSFESGNSNATLKFDTISNPSNPNHAYRTLRAGCISAYDSTTNTNVNLTDYRFDSAQFKKLIDAVSNDGWVVVC